MIANAAAVHAGYGAPTRFLWAMNEVPLSDALLDDLAGMGIDTSLVIADPALADSRNIIVLADGEHTVLTPALGLETIELTDAAFDPSAARGTSTRRSATCARSGMRSGRRAVIDAFRLAGARLVLDLDVGALRPGDEDLVSRADILFVNRRGFDRLLTAGALP